MQCLPTATTALAHTPSRPTITLTTRLARTAATLLQTIPPSASWPATTTVR